MTYDFPRRVQMQKWCEAEYQIQAAVDIVELMGADLRLTDAVCLLAAARDRVADFVDKIKGKRVVPAQIPLARSFVEAYAEAAQDPVFQAESAALNPVNTRQSWLIEIPQNDTAFAVWWGGHKFVNDANDAVQFTRKEDAQKVIDGLLLKHCIASEHMWS